MKPVPEPVHLFAAADAADRDDALRLGQRLLGPGLLLLAIVFLVLDIDMPNLSGMQLTDLLRDKGIMIVFCTAYSEFAVESYEKNAIDYLLKPISYNRFLSAFDKVLKKSQSMGKIKSVLSIRTTRIIL